MIKANLIGTLSVSTIPGGGSGGEDTLNTLFNNASEPVEFTMEDDNPSHLCYGFLGGLDVILPATITEVSGNAFEKVNNLLSFSAPGVQYVNSYAFSQCEALSSVSLPACIEIYDMAFYNTGLTSVRLPSLEVLGENAFAGCGALADIYLGYDGVVSVSNTANSISSCGDGCTVHVPAAQLSAYQADANWTAAIAIAANEGVTITFAGDYSEPVE